MYYLKLIKHDLDLRVLARLQGFSVGAVKKWKYSTKRKYHFKKLGATFFTPISSGCWWTWEPWGVTSTPVSSLLRELQRLGPSGLTLSPLCLTISSPTLALQTALGSKNAGGRGGGKSPSTSNPIFSPRLRKSVTVLSWVDAICPSF